MNKKEQGDLQAVGNALKGLAAKAQYHDERADAGEHDCPVRFRDVLELAALPLTLVKDKPA